MNLAAQNPLNKVKEKILKLLDQRFSIEERLTIGKKEGEKTKIFSLNKDLAEDKTVPGHPQSIGLNQQKYQE